MTENGNTAPILLLAFNRPAMLRGLAGILSGAKPPRIYLAVDGPRPGRAGEAAKCAECRERFGSPCTRFCPAEVYRMEDGALEIDFSNCLHCKTCRIKCPMGNIDWTFPQGGDGPRYTRM